MFTPILLNCSKLSSPLIYVKVGKQPWVLQLIKVGQCSFQYFILSFPKVQQHVFGFLDWTVSMFCSVKHFISDCILPDEKNHVQIIFGQHDTFHKLAAANNFTQLWNFIYFCSVWLLSLEAEGELLNAAGKTTLQKFSVCLVWYNPICLLHCV